MKNLVTGIVAVSFTCISLVACTEESANPTTSKELPVKSATRVVDATSPEEYVAELQGFNIILSERGEDANTDVKEWLLDTNSGYPDLADKLIEVLSNRRPKGNSTVLDGIMGKYKIIKGKKPDGYIQPPYDVEDVKHAYVKNWKDRNSGIWSGLSEDVKSHYDKAFEHITSP